MAKSIGFIYSPTNLVSGSDRILKDLESAAETLGVKLLPVEARHFDDFRGSFRNSCERGVGCVKALVDLAARHKIPTVYPIREFAAGVGLVSY